MTRIRSQSPKLFANILARRFDLAKEEIARKVVLSRAYWTGAQDHDSCHDYRLSQLLGVGMIDDADLKRAIESCEADGFLVPPEVAATEMEGRPPIETAQLLEAQAHLAAVARLAETIAGDVGGMGTHALTNAKDLGPRLAAIHDQLAALCDELRAARGGYVAEQMERAGVAGAKELKVHLGAGPTRLPGWVNIDVFPAEVSLNLSWGLPFDDGSVACIYAGHVFEHLYYAAEALALLREVKRVLKPGGVFRFIVPDMGLFLRKYAAGDRGFFDYWRKHAVKYFDVFTTPMEMIMMYSFVGREVSEFFAHKMGYDLETLEKLAHRAGFATVTQSSYMASEHPELRVDEISVAAKLAYEGEHYSLFVELTR